jgi:polyphosphate kinase 2 (PPK2 family)
VARVHKLAPKDVWSDRYDQINDFEKMLSKNRVVILKFFLHISKEEQLRRLKQRVEDPRKNWKLSPSDFPERKFWDDYTDAYEDALSKCSTRRAPWYVIPADKKWFRNLAVSEIMIDALTDLKLKYPPPKFDVKQLHEAVEAAGAQ